MATFNDIMTPGKFDNLYYQNLHKGLGLLKSDQELASKPRTAHIVIEYTKDEKLFFRDFVMAIEKLGLHGVKTERDKEVWRRFNGFN
ncbi:uncharacterized protein A4U43_C02F20110 [Asparagus officinalis]|uniref:Plant heme peroxidase family profile domain-containing protein n=1 Tax=Asparagus officinalis TaxID=4686 RepID=A0A5P1FPI9_ASPOF|nr:uncharacterized protein A4U43_C02F20110 [Asparagus officinalis]